MTESDTDRNARRVSSLLDRGSVVVLTGAGLSTSSGIPDYRDHAARRRLAGFRHLALGAVVVQRDVGQLRFGDLDYRRLGRMALGEDLNMSASMASGAMPGCSPEKMVHVLCAVSNKIASLNDGKLDSLAFCEGFDLVRDRHSEV